MESSEGTIGRIGAEWMSDVEGSEKDGNVGFVPEDLH